MVRAAVALGSNVGDRLSHMRAAVDGLSRSGTVVATSPLFESEPVGGPDQGPYLNAVVLVDTDRTPRDLLSDLLALEKERGRVRDVRWGPRTLDLDIVSMEGVTLDEPDLHVPHRRAHERGFVAVPLARVWPDAVLADGSSAEEAAARLGTAGLFEWAGDWTVEPPHLGAASRRWVGGQLVLLAMYGVVLAATGRPEAGPLAWIGAVVAALGLVLGGWAVLALGRNLSPYPQPLPSAVLVERGPYRLSRHPIYGAIVVGLAGVAIAFGSWPGLVLAAGVGLFLGAKSAVEERALVLNVAGYAEYRSRVRARMIPLLW